MTVVRSVPIRTAVLCGIAVLGTACGAATQSARSAPTTSTTTTRPPPAAAELRRAVTAGRLRFTVPSSWTVGHGICRCNWGPPGTVTLDNGKQIGEVECSCPMESATAPSALHLYEGQGGLVPGGRSTVINGVRAFVESDPMAATLTATFPTVGQWFTISPGPPPTSGSGIARQVVQEDEILATVTVVPAGSG